MTGVQGWQNGGRGLGQGHR